MAANLNPTNPFLITSWLLDEPLEISIPALSGHNP
jgi:hypothetical protein